MASVTTTTSAISDMGGETRPLFYEVRFLRGFSFWYEGILEYIRMAFLEKDVRLGSKPYVQNGKWHEEVYNANDERERRDAFSQQ